MPNSILDDPENRATASDVIIRFCEHGQYGKDEAKALKALARRIPGQSNDAYTAVLHFLSALLQETIVAVKESPRMHKPEQKYADFSDIDTSDVLARLNRKFPDYARETLGTFIEWVIYWHYLR
jgi:hypothetical protein